MTRLRLAIVGLVALWAGCSRAPAADSVLYEKQSAFNTIVVTENAEGLRELRFGRNGVRQSVVKVGDPDHLELSYARAMMVGLSVVEQPSRVLVVGLGGGSIPSFLHKHYPKTVIDAVDIDPGVVEVAKRFFGFREDATLRAHVADGRRFIEDCRQPYDLIFLDAFSADSIPYSLATREFLTSVRQALRPGGIVVANIWSASSNPLHDAMVRTYQEVFGELYIVDVQNAGNEILLGLPEKRALVPRNLAERAAEISQSKGFRFKLGDVVTYGFRPEAEKDPAARVLLDKNR